MTRKASGPNFNPAMRHLTLAAVEFRDIGREHRDTSSAIVSKMLFEIGNALMSGKSSSGIIAALAAEFDDWMAEPGAPETNPVDA
jgi:hypothetical protein